MSISPSNYPSASSSSSSSSSSHQQNPNYHPNHGNCFSQSTIHLNAHVDDTQSHLHISNRNLPGSSSAPAPETTTTSKKVMNKTSESSCKTFPNRQHNGQRGGGTAQYRQKPHSANAVSPNQSSSPGSSHPSNSNTSRKHQMVNGNHLLNFHYDPISRPKPRTHLPSPPQRRHHKRKPYNKDLFLQANYKFVLLDSGVHSPETLDPDKMLVWEDIVCVKFATPVSVQCPICLDEPLCPQITSCGHIFCFPCILRYFLNTEDDHKEEVWKKCPLCFVMISSKDTYTICIENVKQHSVGDTVEFMLLTRQKDSCVLSLKNKESVGTKEEAPDLFSKFTFTSDVDLSVRNAVSDLDSWLAKADSGLVDDIEKLPYVCAALEQLEQKRKYWNERQLNHPGSKGSAPGKLMQGPVTGGADVKLKRVVGDVVDVADSNKGVVSSHCEKSKGKQSNSDDSAEGKENDSYSFYQAVDGQHLILHPLNLKCLLHHYGSYDKLPHRISGKILQLETITQSEAMRRRYRHISHFSLTTTLQLCEIDLTGSLPPDALSPFMDEIKNRESQRKRLAKKERQEKIAADAAASAALANDMAATLPYNNIVFSSQGPSYSMDDFEALGGGSAPVMSSSPPIGGMMHFANVTRLGFAAGHDSPALRTTETSTLHNKPKSETTSRDSSAATIGGMMGKNTSFANVISRAKEEMEKGVEEAPKTNETRGKKGKKATRVLLSTGGGRRY